MVGAKLKEDTFQDEGIREEPDHILYRKLQRRGFRDPIRDLPARLQEEQSRQAYKFYVENPIIRRLAKMSAEFIIGNGVTIPAKHKDPNVEKQIQTELDEWWSDPVNNWDKRHYTLAVELPLMGEWSAERVPNLFTGRHRYNSIDPLVISDVIAHEKFPTVPAWLILAGKQLGQQAIKARILNNVPEQDMLLGQNTPGTDPMVFYFTTNNLSSALRGHSNYYPLFEWADVLDNAAFTMAERMVIMLTYVWHIQQKNMKEKEKKTLKRDLENAGPATVAITDPETTLEPKTPDLKSADFVEGARFLRNFIAGSAGIPEHWLGEGGDVNRATATAMNMPTIRSFRQQQREYVTVLRTLCRANLQSVAARGRIPADAIDSFTVQVDPLDPADVTAIGSALGSLVVGLETASINGWVSDDQARDVIHNVLSGLADMDEDQLPPAVRRVVQQSPELADAARRLKRAFDDVDTTAA